LAIQAETTGADEYTPATIRNKAPYDTCSDLAPVKEIGINDLRTVWGIVNLPKYMAYPMMVIVDVTNAGMALLSERSDQKAMINVTVRGRDKFMWHSNYQ
jgi:hypothetical protein